MTHSMILFDDEYTNRIMVIISGKTYKIWVTSSFLWLITEELTYVLRTACLMRQVTSLIFAMITRFIKVVLFDLLIGPACQREIRRDIFVVQFCCSQRSVLKRSEVRENTSSLFLQAIVKFRFKSILGRPVHQSRLLI